MSGKHGPNTWDNYQAVHDSCLRDYDHFIVEDGLEAIPTQTLVKWDGILYCAGGLEIHVDKTQRVSDRGGQLMVQTTEYKYHVQRKVGTRTIKLFRYDNVHVQPDHPDHHHRHRFDENGDEIEPTEYKGVEGWPTLGEVLQEAYDLAHSQGWIV
jgi:hypothetical protein